MSHIHSASVLLLVVCAVNRGLAYRSYDYSCECGTRSSFAQYRIANGQRAQPQAFPWLVTIKLRGELFCGGTIINDRYILTAGHCIRWSEKEDMTVMVGQYSRLKRDGIEIRVHRKILHNSFNSHMEYDEVDIGMLKLARKLQFSARVLPICLPRTNSLFVQVWGTVAGWGIKSETERETNILRQTQVQVLSNEECSRTKLKRYLDDRMMCAYGKNTDVCRGDSGGPLSSERASGRSEIIGIVSFGKGCVTPGVPGIYTRVTSYLDWINYNSRDGVWCMDDSY